MHAKYIWKLWAMVVVCDTVQHCCCCSMHSIWMRLICVCQCVWMCVCACACVCVWGLCIELIELISASCYDKCYPFSLFGCDKYLFQCQFVNYISHVFNVFFLLFFFSFFSVFFCSFDREIASPARQILLTSSFS